MERLFQFAKVFHYLLFAGAFVQITRPGGSASRQRAGAQPCCCLALDISLLRLVYIVPTIMIELSRTSSCWRATVVSQKREWLAGGLAPLVRLSLSAAMAPLFMGRIAGAGQNRRFG